MRRRVPADDDELLLVDGLDLQPLLRAPPLVDRRLPLGDDPFPPVLSGLQQRAVARHRQLLRKFDERGRTAQRALEQLAAVGVRQLADVVAVEPKDVEDEDELAVALLEELEARASLFVERDDLAVEHGLRHLQLPQRLGDFGEARREVDLVAAPHRQLAAGDRGDGAEAVVFELVDPLVLVARRRGGERRKHRREDFAQQRLRLHDATTRTSSKPSSRVGGISFFFVVKIATSGTRALPSRCRFRMIAVLTSVSKWWATMRARGRRPMATSGARTSAEGLVLSTTTDFPPPRAASISRACRSSRRGAVGMRALLTGA